MKRIFVAIKITPEDKLMQTMYHLRHVLKQDKIKWVEMENHHITLKFIGETHESRIEEISQTLHGLTDKCFPFSFQLKGVGVFGSAYKPRVLWAGIKDAEELKELGQRVHSELAKIGYETDRQNFVPHLTLGRIKHLENKKGLSTIVNSLNEEFFQKCTIDHFLLMESVLKPRGPEYTILNKYILNKKSP